MNTQQDSNCQTGILGVIVEKDVEIPMRDGVILRANIFRPDGEGEFPAILVRTPYDKKEADIDHYDSRSISVKEAARAGYVVVVQDTRGRYTSDGDYPYYSVEDNREAEDGYDTVEWIAEQTYCNGRVGTMGISYRAWMQWQLAKLRPPHLKALCAYSIPVELGDTDWTNGIFRMGRRIHWWMNAIAPDLRKRQGMGRPHTPGEAKKIWDEIEDERWLGFLPWLDLPRYLPGGLAEAVRDWFEHPNKRAWKFDEAHHEVEVPNLDFSGWYDHCQGTIEHLEGMQKNGRTETARKQSKLVIGPWNHAQLGQRKLGGIDFGPLAEINMHDMIIRWFDHWLKGLDNGIEQEPAVRYFVMGSNEWKTAPGWPVRGSKEQVYYLNSDGKADQVSTSGALSSELLPTDSPDHYVYDPNNPAPTLWTKEFFTVPSDRSLLEYREDILYYRTEPLKECIEVVGNPEMILYAASSARDTDFFARLVDEYPDGRALEISHGAVRARYRNSLDKEELLTPGEVYRFKINLGPTACRFMKGHRIRLEITSSDYPNYDRNHNTGKNDLANSELIPAEQSVFHSEKYPSQIHLPVMDVQSKE